MSGATITSDRADTILSGFVVRWQAREPTGNQQRDKTLLSKPIEWRVSCIPPDLAHSSSTSHLFVFVEYRVVIRGSSSRALAVHVFPFVRIGYIHRRRELAGPRATDQRPVLSSSVVWYSSKHMASSSR